MSVPAINPGRVPLPPFDSRVYSPQVERMREWLTGGLPPPAATPADWMTCSACRQKVRRVKITTSVPGASAVFVKASHLCVPSGSV